MNILQTVDPWKHLDRFVDPYPLIRPFLFLLDPEFAHELTLKILDRGLGPNFHGPDDGVLRTNVFNIDFPNPIHLGAGLDKQAALVDAFMGFGFGSIEVGTVTPLPQAGNPRPRMFRVPSAKGLINRFGFNSLGAEAFAKNMKAWSEKEEKTKNPVGINIGKNKETEADAADYVTCFEKVAPYANYITINISSPNTPNLRDLQDRERMAALIEKVTAARDEQKPELPILVKIAPDLSEEQQADIAAVMLESKAQGLIIGNTTLARPSTIPDDIAQESGGLSGPALFGPSTRLLAGMYKMTEGKVPLIGCGGVSSGLDAYTKIRAGASLIQIYTALVFEGPLVVQKIKRELAILLRRDGFGSVAEAVGADHR